MNTDTPPAVVANLRVDIQFRGRDTLAEVRQLTDADREYMGITDTQIPINPDLTADIVGEGKARCRKEDHYESVLGIELAASRALIDFAEKSQARAESVVMTERQFQAGQAANEAVEILRELVRPLQKLTELAASR